MTVKASSTIERVDLNYSKSNQINKFLYTGTWLEPESNQVVVGSGISRRLSLGLFDYNNVLEVLYLNQEKD